LKRLNIGKKRDTMAQWASCSMTGCCCCAAKGLLLGLPTDVDYYFFFLIKGTAQSTRLDIAAAAAGLPISETQTQGSSHETANGRGATPPLPPPLPPGPDALKPDSQQGPGQDEKEGKSARKPDRPIYQPVARPEGGSSAPGLPSQA